MVGAVVAHNQVPITTHGYQGFLPKQVILGVSLSDVWVVLLRLIMEKQLRVREGVVVEVVPVVRVRTQQSTVQEMVDQEYP